MTVNRERVPVQGWIICLLFAVAHGVRTDCAFTYKNTFYVIGLDQPSGATSNFTATSLPIYDTSSPNVTSLQLPDNSYTQLQWPCVVTPNNLLITGGNITSPGSPLQAYNPETNTWQTLPSSANYPGGMVYHVVVNTELWTWNNNGTIWIFDLVGYTWTRSAYTGAIPGYQHPGLVYVNGKIYWFGGSNNTIYYTDILTLDTQSKVWTKLTATLDTPYDDPFIINYNNQSIYMYSGGTTQKFTVSGVRIFDIATQKISLVKATGTEPISRDSPASALYGPDMIIFGGILQSANGDMDQNYYVFNIANSTWEMHTYDAQSRSSSSHSNDSEPSEGSSLGTTSSSSSVPLVAIILPVVVVVAVGLVVAGLLWRRRRNHAHVPYEDTGSNVPLSPLETTVPLPYTKCSDYSPSHHGTGDMGVGDPATGDVDLGSNDTLTMATTPPRAPAHHTLPSLSSQTAVSSAQISATSSYKPDDIHPDSVFHKPHAK